MANVKFLEMLEGQLRAGRDIIGTFVAIAGQPNTREAQYTINSIVMDNGVLKEVTLVRGEEDEQETVKVTEANQAIAHYRCNPNNRANLDMESISIDGDTLKWEAFGEEFSTDLGQIDAKKVIAAFGGKIFLGVTVPQASVYGVIPYDVQIDTFGPIIGAVDKDAKFFLIGDTAFVVSVTTEERKIDEAADGTPITAPFVVDNRILIGNNNGFLTDYDEIDTDLSIVSSIKGSEDGKAILFFSEKEIDDDGKILDLQRPVVDIFYAGCDVLIDTIAVDASIDDVEVFVGGSRDDVITVKTPTELYIISNARTTRITDAAVLKELEGFNTFCRFDRICNEDGKTIAKVTYADKAYNTKVFTIEDTDRGIKVKVM